MARPTIVILVAGMLLLAQTARAQDNDSTLVARYQLAESYLSAAQFDRAIGLLEDIVDRSPDNTVFSERLREAYEAVKRYDDAIALIERRLSGPESRTVLYAEMARLQYLAGDEPSAYATWDKALAAEPDQPGAFLAVYRSLLQMRLFERAIVVLESGRESLGNRDLFRIDLAYLYGLVGRYAEAMNEYLAILEQNDRQITLVRSRLETIIEQPDALVAAIQAAERGVRTQPLNRSIRELLGWLYMEGGRYADALDSYRAIDRLEQMQGQILYGFALQAMDAGAWQPALAAFGEILDRYPDSPAGSDAQAAKGSLFERRAESRGLSPSDSIRGDWQAALDAYRVFLDRYPGHPLQAEVRYRVAHIRLDALFELDQAERDLETLVARFPNDPASDRAAFDLGRLDLLRDRLDASRVHFTRLADRLRTGELAEAARLELALLHYYRGEFEAARAMAESMKENTSADVSNDAIRLKVDLVENRGPDSLDTPLRSYARVQLLHRQRRNAEALDALASMLSSLGNHPLLDDALFLRAQLLRDLGHVQEAVAAFLEFPMVQPLSPMADRALFTAAELDATLLGRLDEAVGIYTRLLETYPGSLLASETRARIRRLRGDGV